MSNETSPKGRDYRLEQKSGSSYVVMHYGQVVGDVEALGSSEAIALGSSRVMWGVSVSFGGVLQSSLADCLGCAKGFIGETLDEWIDSASQAFQP